MFRDDTDGAGKTTTINMLVGVYPATAGTATIDGLSLKDDMSSIYLRMGVCPQVIARPCARASPTPLRSEMLP